MKKIIVLAVLLITVVMVFAGCKMTECDLCGDKGLCHKGEFMGQDIYLCNDCHNGVNEVKDFFS